MTLLDANIIPMDAQDFAFTVCIGRQVVQQALVGISVIFCPLADFLQPNLIKSNHKRRDSLSGSKGIFTAGR